MCNTDFNLFLRILPLKIGEHTGGQQSLKGYPNIRPFHCAPHDLEFGMASATTASALHHYTYALGRSLYVPVTSRCNAVPLPATRGPGFALPRRVAAALLRVRDAECHRGRGEGAAADAAGVDLDAWDLLEEHERVLYPAYTQPLVRGLYRHLGDDALSEQLQVSSVICEWRVTCTRSLRVTTAFF